MWIWGSCGIEITRMQSQNPHLVCTSPKACACTSLVGASVCTSHHVTAAGACRLFRLVADPSVPVQRDVIFHPPDRSRDTQQASVDKLNRVYPGSCPHHILHNLLNGSYKRHRFCTVELFSKAVCKHGSHARPAPMTEEEHSYHGVKVGPLSSQQTIYFEGCLW